MDNKLLEQLRKSREKTEEIETLVIASLTAEREKITELKKELRTHSQTRNTLVLQLVEMGYTAAVVAKFAGIVPSYITLLQKKAEE